MRCTIYFRKLELTECYLVTRTVKVIRTDLEHGPIYQRINNTQFASFFVIGKKSRDRFRINNNSLVRR